MQRSAKWKQVKLIIKFLIEISLYHIGTGNLESWRRRNHQWDRSRRGCIENPRLTTVWRCRCYVYAHEQWWGTVHPYK